MEQKEFFIPKYTGSKEDEERAYQTIRSDAERGSGKFWDSRIYTVTYVHEGNIYTETVGENVQISASGVVVAIFENSDCLFVFAVGRGIGHPPHAAGQPIVVGKSKIKEFKYFTMSV